MCHCEIATLRTNAIPLSRGTGTGPVPGRSAHRTRRRRQARLSDCAQSRNLVGLYPAVGVFRVPGSGF